MFCGFTARLPVRARMSLDLCLTVEKGNPGTVKGDVLVPAAFEWVLERDDFTV